MNQTESKTTHLTEHEQLIQAANTARKEILEKQKEPEISWLTENSRKFLESGYLTGDTTPEERIREIADNAERILKIKGFSDKFYKYMAAGYFSLSSPVWSNFGKKRGMPICCFC
jgi:ribonucleoside-diphosphate reductase alpha chain